MDGVALIPDMVWIKRGVAKHVPEKVTLNPTELRELIQGGEPETSDHSETEEAMDEGDAGKEQPKSGLRGSAPDSEVEDEGEQDKTRNAMAGIAQFTTPLEDPYITKHVDSDDEDREDFEVKPDDNLLAVAKINKGEFGLDVYVFNEVNNDWYVHHDYILDAPPLCLEPIGYDPGAEDRKGNLLGVGTMNSTVNVWDLDVVNAVEPIVTLGGHKPGRKRSKRDGSAQGHSDAVLSLSWNRVTDHVIASGSADQTVILWDLDEAKAATILNSFHDKVQCVEWHPAEASVLLTGTLGGEVALSDCRLSDAEPSRRWNVGAEVERLLWDHFSPFFFFVATDDGKIRYVDSRVDKVVLEADAHEGGTTGLSQSFEVRGLLSSCGADNNLKLWKVGSGGLDELYAEGMGMGGLHTIRFNPDSGAILAVGGEKEDMVRIVPVDKFEPVTRAFSGN